MLVEAQLRLLLLLLQASQLVIMLHLLAVILLDRLLLLVLEAQVGQVLAAVVHRDLLLRGLLCFDQLIGRGGGGWRGCGR